MSLINIKSQDNGVWECELNRPEKLNALSAQLVSELTTFFHEAQAAAESFELRCLLLTSSHPKAFCVGADLKERKGMTDEDVVKTLDALKNLTCALEDIPCPTVAVVEGAAFGGGLELALSADIRFASSAASMGLTETRLAIIPGAGGTQRLSRLVGVATAKELIFSGERMDASRAHSLGIVNRVGESAREDAYEWANGVVEGGPIAMLAAKEAVNASVTKGHVREDALSAERNAYLKTLTSEDRHEGLLAFAEKRKAQYKGR